MYEEKNNSSKQVLLSVLAVAVLVVAVIGVSFAFFTYSKQGATENQITTGSLVFSYNEEEAGINLQNALPITDEDVDTELKDEGEYFDFNVDAKITGTVTIGYTINVATTLDPADRGTLDSKYIKMKLMRGESNLDHNTQSKEPTYFDDLTTSSVLPDNENTYAVKELYKDSISATDTHYYRFYMWMSDQDSKKQPTNMENDVCTKDGQPVGDDNPALECSDSDIEGNKLVTKGTNGKSFKVKLIVTAQDQ